MGSVIWNAGWFAAGAGLGVANMVRHRLLGYRRPRPFARGDVERTIDYVLGVVSAWQRSGLDPRGRRILELGPGPDLGTGFVLVALGAESYTAVDRFPLATNDDPDLYAALAGRLGVDAAATMQRIQYVVRAIPMRGELTASFNAFVSNATLEHLADIPGTFSWMKSLGTPGAIHVHLVDAQTHMRWVRPRDPWNILRYPNWMYRLMKFPGAPNRMLVSDYLAEAQRAGFSLSIVAGDRADEEYLHRVRPFLAGAFRERTGFDLALLNFTLVGGMVPAAAERDASRTHRDVVRPMVNRVQAGPMVRCVRTPGAPDPRRVRSAPFPWSALPVQLNER